jgi:hypothetical protein
LGAYSKKKGSARETWLIHRLERGGRYVCTKSGGSLGSFDVIALPLVRTEWTGMRYALAIQVKSNAWPRTYQYQEIAAVDFPEFVKKLVVRIDDPEGDRKTLLVRAKVCVGRGWLDVPFEEFL